jgi:hypothetical protein
LSELVDGTTAGMISSIGSADDDESAIPRDSLGCGPDACSVSAVQPDRPSGSVKAIRYLHASFNLVRACLGLSAFILILIRLCIAFLGQSFSDSLWCGNCESGTPRVQFAYRPL